MLSESALDFSLFDVRRDSAYYWKTLRSEMKTRGDEMVARRKPNNRNVLFQTIKCMLAIRRKKNEKKDGFSTVERSETLLASETENESETSSLAPEEEFQEAKLVIKLQHEEHTAASQLNIGDQRPPSCKDE
ncbi:hypothetical protein GWI33_018320 [Rhynchophorus ferrugineus]|uniref:Uncharacterized protein n=1 Tax=Rhynchophorus ferrugineus TaxID=354439 RepID=A0A834HXB8_RHYFE|nr:hypothetical protein GWI33_018320 [Rhynchophorus ferrugineus]